VEAAAVEEAEAAVGAAAELVAAEQEAEPTAYPLEAQVLGGAEHQEELSIP
jgi:hypothetical protein